MTDSRAFQNQLNLLLLVLITVVGGYLVYLYGYPFLNHYQLKSATKQIAEYSAVGALSQSRLASGESNSIESIREAVLTEAKLLGILLRRQDISVEKADGQVSITVEYTVPIQIWRPVYNILPIQMPSLSLSFTENN